MPSLKGTKLQLNGPDTKVKGGPVTNVKKVGLGTQHTVKGFAFDTPDKAGGGWTKKGK